MELKLLGAIAGISEKALVCGEAVGRLECGECLQAIEPAEATVRGTICAHAG